MMYNNIKQKMEIYTLEHSLFLLQKEGTLNGYYWLYPDNTETLIEDNPGSEKIKDSYSKDVAVGKEIGFFNGTLLDGKPMKAPKIIDISNMGSLDQLEYSMWHTIEEYLAYFGIETDDDDPDWATVKEVQDRLLNILTNCGINFYYDARQPRRYPALKETDIFVGTDFSIEHDMEWGECVSFCLDTYFDVDAYFGENTNSKDDTWINFYAEVNLSGTDVKGFYVVSSDEIEEIRDWTFTLKEKVLILQKCEERCKKETGKSISEFAKEY